MESRLGENREEGKRESGSGTFIKLASTASADSKSKAIFVGILISFLTHEKYACVASSSRP
jgi:hypothetical protein